MAESNILRNRYLQAGWLAEILVSDSAKRRTNVRQNVARHWESLGGKIEPKVRDFATSVAEYLSQEDKKSLLDRFDKYSAHAQGIEVHLQMNMHACSKPVEGHHLSTGHVFRVEAGRAQYQYWLCLTPACDLEPGQNEGKGWSKRLGAWLPFKAVRLHPACQDVALKDATRGYHLFLIEDGKITTYGFSEAQKDKTAYNTTPTLSWEQFFAESQGKFTGSNELTIASIGKDSGLAFDEKQAVVVAQLRYEYALNLMQRLGSHLSRVGLDFVSYDKVEAG
ncbi:MAG: hypothetical protein NVS3B3_21090 [Aquirhabdus sp.]